MPSLALVVLILLVAFPLLELAILIKVGGIIGVPATFAIIFGTAIAGAMMVRHQGLGVARRMMHTVRAGTPPVEPMLEGMLLMAAGACLIAPGLITDVVGLVLLIPPIRRFTAALIIANGFGANVWVHTASRTRSASSPGHEHRPGRQAGGSAPTIEGDYERLDERTVSEPQAPGPRRPSPPDDRTPS